MDRHWSPPTPCDMVCPDCRVKLPRGTRHHGCALSAFQQRMVRVYTKGVQGMADYERARQRALAARLAG
jgi:hypothetical protein